MLWFFLLRLDPLPDPPNPFLNPPSPFLDPQLLLDPQQLLDPQLPSWTPNSLPDPLTPTPS